MKAIKIVVAYNEISPAKEGDTEGYENRKDVETISDILKDSGHEVFPVSFKEPVEFISLMKELNPDVVFNLVEEAIGEARGEMLFCSLLELFSIPYTGSQPVAIGLCLNKEKTKSILRTFGIPTPSYRVVEKLDDIDNVDRFDFPSIVKPLSEDASFGIENSSVVFESKQLFDRVHDILNTYKQPALVEKYIDGRELNVAIIDGAVMPISEIDFSTLPSGMPRICNYDAKWTEDSVEYQNTVPVCPSTLSEDLERMVRDIALESYNIMGCRDYARVDIRVSKYDVPYVIEVNPNPDISFDAGFSRSAMASGISYAQLIEKLAELPIKREQK